MEYFIDGYNLIFRLHLEKSSLEKKREKIIHFLNSQNTYLGWRITLIFDGEHWNELLPEIRQYGTLSIVYTSKKTNADDFIIQELEHHPWPENVTVVTSDKGLSFRSKALGGKVMSIESFIKKIHVKHEKKTYVECSEKKMEEELPFHLKRLQEIFEKKLREIK